MRRKRRNHSPAYKAKVAVAAIKGDRMLAELSEQFGIRPKQIQDWCKRLLDNADTMSGLQFVLVIRRRGDRQYLTDRLNRVCALMLVNKGG